MFSQILSEGSSALQGISQASNEAGGTANEGSILPGTKILYGSMVSLQSCSHGTFLRMNEDDTCDVQSKIPMSSGVVFSIQNAVDRDSSDVIRYGDRVLLHMGSDEVLATKVDINREIHRDAQPGFIYGKHGVQFNDNYAGERSSRTRGSDNLGTRPQTAPSASSSQNRRASSSMSKISRDNSGTKSKRGSISMPGVRQKKGDGENEESEEWKCREEG